MPLLMTILVILLPIVALFSGMAMTPMVIMMSLVVILGVYQKNNAMPRVPMHSFLALITGLSLLLAWPLITTFWSITPHHSLDVALRVIVLCVIGTAGFLYAPSLPAPSTRMLNAYAISFILCSVLMLQEKILGQGLIYLCFTALERNYELFMIKNMNRGICALAVLVWPLVFTLHARGRARDAWLILGLLLVAILAMHSLSAKIGLLAGIVAFVGIGHYPRFFPRAMLVALPLFFLAFPLLFLIAERTIFANEQLILKLLPLSSVHRIHIWHELMNHVREHLWFGLGMDTTRAMPLTEYALKVLWITEPPLHPHSPSLQVLLEEGVVGLLLSVAGLVVLLRAWVRMEHADGIAKATAGAIILSFFVTGISSFGIWQTWWISVLWISGVVWQWMRFPKENQ
jgi:exopolysaccharide production protein ExoQ